MAVLQSLLLWMIAYVALHGASGHRVHQMAHVSDERFMALELKEEDEEEMRKEAVKSFKPPKVWMPTVDLMKCFIHKASPCVWEMNRRTQSQHVFGKRIAYDCVVVVLESF